MNKVPNRQILEQMPVTESLLGKIKGKMTHGMYFVHTWTYM